MERRVCPVCHGAASRRKHCYGCNGAGWVDPDLHPGLRPEARQSTESLWDWDNLWEAWDNLRDGDLRSLWTLIPAILVAAAGIWILIKFII